MRSLVAHQRTSNILLVSTGRLLREREDGMMHKPPEMGETIDLDQEQRKSSCCG